MSIVRFIAWTVTASMAVAIALGSIAGGFGDDASAIWALPWGKVSIIDLYLGLVIFGGWIAIRERSRQATAIWWVALAVTGNLAAGVYLVIASHRANDLNELLTGKASVAA